MVGERAKELAARQKLEAQKLKEAKKHSDDPNDWGPVKQITETLKMTVQELPSSKWWLSAGLILPIIIGVGALLLFKFYFGPIYGVLIGLTLAMFLLSTLAKTAVYKKYEGEPGAAQVALGMLNKKRWSHTPAISATRQEDCVHRAVGPAGIVLIGDGDASRSRGLLNTERRRHEQLAYDVPVSTLSVGRGQGQIPLNRAVNAINRLPRKLSKAQVAQVENRLKALDSNRGRLPLPQGPMPSMKGARKAMKGR